MTNFAAAMKDSTLRFFAVEHFAGMLLAIIIAQQVFDFQAGDDRSCEISAGRDCLLARGLLILASIPWPFMKYGRPLFPPSWLSA